MAKQPKFYVVWHGRETGVFDSWEACKEQTDGFPSPIFKSFNTRKAAEIAFESDSAFFVGKRSLINQIPKEKLAQIGIPIKESIAVDGAWNITTGVVEYQAVCLDTYETLFHKGPFEDGTNNIVEFLAIVHALALCKQHSWTVPIYSDSKIALGWVKDKKAKTNHPPSEKNKKLFEMLARAEKWLENNTYENPLIKWETKAWGENPADFGRK